MFFWTVLILVIVILLRFLYLVFGNLNARNHKCFTLPNLPVKLAVVIGSGGHTTEMLRLVDKLDFKLYSPRLYIMASTDKSSEVKIHTIENTEKGRRNLASQEYIIAKIPRSRKVHQSYITSVFTTVHSILWCIPLVMQYRPDVVLCNGPGTCIPICIVAFMMKLLWMKNCLIVFIESVCRVKTLSLSGKILLYFADIFFVQWQSLKDMYQRTLYVGRLV